MQSRTPDGLPPALPFKPTEAILRYYVAWARCYQVFLKMNSCCGPECCQAKISRAAMALQQTFRDAAYLAKVNEHLTGCVNGFIRGLGKLNCMRDDMHESHREDRRLRIDDTHLLEIARVRIRRDILQSYEGLATLDRGLQQNPGNLKRSSLDQFKYLRAYVLGNPKTSVPNEWTVPDFIASQFRLLGIRFGRNSLRALEFELNRLDVQAVPRITHEALTALGPISLEDFLLAVMDALAGSTEISNGVSPNAPARPPSSGAPVAGDIQTVSSSIQKVIDSTGQLQDLAPLDEYQDIQHALQELDARNRVLHDIKVQCAEIARREGGKSWPDDEMAEIQRLTQIASGMISEKTQAAEGRQAELDTLRTSRVEQL